MKQTKEFTDILAQFTNGSLGNTDFVFDLTTAADAAGHSGIFANTTQWEDKDFTW